ncbi:hypothetical protein MUG91_G216n17 [Manis pentadactyla]|nr:hypothetical protein MUG91_G216n17 [Manis pentadactyla]
MRAGTWARPHPTTHPSAGAGPRERPPGMKRSPVPSRIYEIPNLPGSGGSQPQRPPIPNCPTQTSAWIRESRFQTPTASSPPRPGERALSLTPSDWKNLRCLPTAFGVSSLSPSPFETTSHEDSTRRRLAGVMRGVDVHRLVLEPPLFLVE